MEKSSKTNWYKTKNPKFTFEVLKERKTRLELATTSLEGWSSTN